jgi:hypothetical protein
MSPPSSCFFTAWLILRPWKWSRHVLPKGRLAPCELHSVIFRKIEHLIKKFCGRNILFFEAEGARLVLKDLIIHVYTSCSRLVVRQIYHTFLPLTLILLLSETGTPVPWGELQQQCLENCNDYDFENISVDKPRVLREIGGSGEPQVLLYFKYYLQLCRSSVPQYFSFLA